MKKILILACLTIILISCTVGESLKQVFSPSPTSTSTPELSSTHTPSPTIPFTPVPTATETPKPFYGELPGTAKTDGDQIVFDQWGFSAEMPSTDWKFIPEFYLRECGKEIYKFSPRIPIIDPSRKAGFSDVYFSFYSVDEGTQLLDFSNTLQTQLGASFPKVERVFGIAGLEPAFGIQGLGYYGHYQNAENAPVYIIHSVKGKVGVQIAFVVKENFESQATPGFVQIMKSLKYLDGDYPLQDEACSGIHS
jgi:hypothetical protein